MNIIPAIDIIEGKCVRLRMGDYARKTIYNEDPVEVAKEFEAHGIQHLHVVDLDGARSSRIVNHKILQALCTQTNLIIDFGGGLKSNEDVRIAFESGAQKITGGSIALKDRDLFMRWLEHYGADRIILGADCKSRMIATNGWLESSTADVVTYIRAYKNEGVRQVICTDISKDGMLQGPSLDLYQEIVDEAAVELIASGGVSSMEDLRLLKQLGCHGAIVGKAIYEQKISLKELATLC